MNQTSIIIGNEYDEELISSLKKTLKELKAVKKYENNTVAGSQDFYCANFDIDGSNLTIEIETYIGITLTGSLKLIEEIKNRVYMLTDREN